MNIPKAFFQFQKNVYLANLIADMTGVSCLFPLFSCINAAASLHGSPPPKKIPVIFLIMSTFSSLKAVPSSSVTGIHKASKGK